MTGVAVPLIVLAAVAFIATIAACLRRRPSFGQRRGIADAGSSSAYGSPSYVATGGFDAGSSCSSGAGDGGSCSGGGSD